MASTNPLPSDLLTSLKEHNQRIVDSTTMNQEIRIVLVGKTGVGKSAAGNTILGEKLFVSEPRATSVTKECKFASRMVNRRQICVVDTPGLYDTQLSSEELFEEVVKCIKYAAPGPHVFLLVIAIGRFTAEEKNTTELIQTLFGQEVLRHMMVLFTRADDLEDRRIEDYIEEAPDIKKVINACTGKYHTFNNREQSNRTQVDEFMSKIIALIKQNQNGYYSHHMFTRAYELNNIRKSMKEKDKIIAELKKELKTLQKGTDKSSCSIL